MSARQTWPVDVGDLGPLDDDPPLIDDLMLRIARAVARVFLARWYERTAPPPPCPDQSLHTEGRS